MLEALYIQDLSNKTHQADMNCEILIGSWRDPYNGLFDALFWLGSIIPYMQITMVLVTAQLGIHDVLSCFFSIFVSTKTVKVDVLSFNSILWKKMMILFVAWFLLPKKHLGASANKKSPTWNKLE